MADIKKIIELGKFIKQSMFDGSYKQNPAFDEGILLFTSNALELLKEQEEIIKELQNAYGYLQKQFFETQDNMLKEQEAMPVRYSAIGCLKYGACPKCGARVDDLVYPKACGFCGQAVKWDG